jgi:hypothetical protein
MEESSRLCEFNMNWFDYSLATGKYFAYKHGFLYGPHLIHHHIRVHPVAAQNNKNYWCAHVGVDVLTTNK